MTIPLINRRSVKLLALVTMFIDHIGSRLSAMYPEWFEQTLLLRSIGRLAFPLFAFQMGLTFRRTNHLSTLVINLVILALLSEIPYDLMLSNHWLNTDNQNVVWNFVLVGLSLLISQQLHQSYPRVDKGLVELICALLFSSLSTICHVDYGMVGFLLTYWFTLNTTKEATNLLPLLLYDFWWVKNSLFLTPFLIHFYDERTIRFGRWEGLLYHYFYPIHMLIIYWVIS